MTNSTVILTMLAEIQSDIIVETNDNPIESLPCLVLKGQDESFHPSESLTIGLQNNGSSVTVTGQGNLFENLAWVCNSHFASDADSKESFTVSKESFFSGARLFNATMGKIKIKYQAYIKAKENEISYAIGNQPCEA